jgi:uncharacterized protein (DUF2132 family)
VNFNLVRLKEEEIGTRSLMSSVYFFWNPKSVRVRVETEYAHLFEKLPRVRTNPKSAPEEKFVF